MTVHDHEPHAAIDNIQGEYVDIQIHNPSELAAWLETYTGNRLIALGDEDTLPHPLNSFRMYYDRHIGDNNEAAFDVEVHIEFDTDKVENASAQPWQRHVATIIRDSIDEPETIYTLPHEVDVLYFLIDKSTVARIEPSTSPHACYINIEMCDRTDIETRLSARDISALHQVTLEPYEAVHEMAKLTGWVIDSVANLYGSQPRHLVPSTIVITPPADLAPEEKHLPELVSSMPQIEQTTTTESSFTMLGGLERPKQQLQLIANTFLDPEGSAEYDLSPSHFLLYGPAGTGKTSLVEAFGHYIDAPIMHILSSDIMDQYVGGSGKHLTEQFEKAFDHSGPLVVFFDEFDSLAGTVGPDTKSNLEVKNLLKQHLTKASKEYPNIIVAAATNGDLDKLDPAIVRSGRFEKISVPLPTEAERADIWSSVLYKSMARFLHDTELQVNSDPENAQFTISNEKITPYDETINPAELAQYTDGMTGADFEAILLQARRHCYMQHRATGEHQKVNQQLLLDLVAAFYRN